MKTAEEYFNELNTAAIHPAMKKHIVSAIKLAQRDAYNEALEDVKEYGMAEVHYTRWGKGIRIHKPSIDKLKKL